MRKPDKPDISDIPNDCPKMSGSQCPGLYCLSGHCPVHVRVAKTVRGGRAYITQNFTLFLVPLATPKSTSVVLTNW